MRVILVCVGRLSRDYQAIYRHYEGLVRPYAKLEVEEVPEVPLAAGKDRAKQREGEQLLARLREGAYVVAVDPRGEEFSSEELSAFLARKKCEGVSTFQFVIGGAAGLDQRVLERAAHIWSLSRLTFPHQMARCIVVEQLYRAVKIERGEPYHH